MQPCIDSTQSSYILRHCTCGESARIGRSRFQNHVSDSVHMSSLHHIIDQAFPIFRMCTQYTTLEGLGTRLLWAALKLNLFCWCYCLLHWSFRKSRMYLVSKSKCKGYISRDAGVFEIYTPRAEGQRLCKLHRH